MEATRFVSIDYDEMLADSYRAVEVIRSGAVEQRYETGDVVQDWKSAIEYLRGVGGRCLFTSSCDHFVMDVPCYKFDENEMIVKTND